MAPRRKRDRPQGMDHLVTQQPGRRAALPIHGQRLGHCVRPDPRAIRCVASDTSAVRRHAGTVTSATTA